jgi:hypothetical protein
VPRGKTAGREEGKRSAAYGRNERRQGEDSTERERKNRGGREKELPKDSCVKLENCRDPSVKHKFLINLKPE